MAGIVDQSVCFDPENETLERGALRALQRERLQHVVAAAYERSETYRAMCR